MVTYSIASLSALSVSANASQYCTAIVVSGMPMNPQLENTAEKEAAAFLPASSLLRNAIFTTIRPNTCTAIDRRKQTITFTGVTSVISTDIMQ